MARIAPVRLGELLEKRGDVTREQLLRALRNQKVLGGRLGTCLLEIEALTEEQLCSALSEQHGVPCASPEDLRGIPDDLLELLPSKVAKRCHAIAFHASTTQVKVALVEARNLAFQDEISFVVGKRIRWHVAPELRLIEALEKHYGEECPSRLAKLLDKMNRSRFLWAREGAALPTGGAARQTGDQLKWDTKIAGVPAAAATPAPSIVEAQSTVSLELPHFQHETLDLPSLAPVATAPAAPAPAAGPPAAPAASPARSPAASPAAPPAAPPPTAAAEPAAVQQASPAARALPPSVEETEQRLLQAHERDDVARAMIDFAAGRVLRTALFVVRKEEVAAWFWTGAGIDGERLAALRLNLKQPSLFDGLKEKGGSFRGALSSLPAHSALGACFTAPPLAPDVLVLPVKVKDRLVAGLLLEPRATSGSELSAADLADLQRVIAKAEIAFELCIMQSKLRKA